MGGLLIRYALHRVAVGDPNFPPFLTVPRAVTLATPHAGLRPAATRSICGRTVQCKAMRSDSVFISELTNHALDPQGLGGTAWTIAGASRTCDLVPPWSALALPAAERVRYVHPCYSHGDWLWDYSDAKDATMRVTQPNASSAVTITDGRHSLAWLTAVLLR
jgi:hypothetical protein